VTLTFDILAVQLLGKCYFVGTTLPTSLFISSLVVAHLWSGLYKAWRPWP